MIVLCLLFSLCLLGCSQKNNSKINLENELPEKFSYLNKEQQNDILFGTEKLEFDLPTQFQKFKGTWLRTDFLDILVKNKSMFKTIENFKSGDTFFGQILSISLSPRKTPTRENSITFIMSHYTELVPAHFFVSPNAIKQKEGFNFSSYNAKEPELQFIDIIDNQLKMTIYENQQKKEYFFTKVTETMSEYTATKHLIFPLIIGNYKLLDKDNKIIKNNIFFDKNGKTNFPNFQNFGLIHPYENTLKELKYFQKDKNKIEKAIKNGILDDEEVLKLTNSSFYTLFAIKYDRDTFLLYPTKNTMIGRKEMLYKKELYCKLVPLKL